MLDGQTDPTGRVLQLLSLLQTHRRWTSHELAAELSVTTRTVRRDIDRLRGLGYPVDAAPGSDGGYRLAAGAHLPPLMFDDDEAVALAVGLWSATSAPLEGIEQTALRALAKLEDLLPDRLRRRTSAIATNASTHRWQAEPAMRAGIETLSTVASACRDHEEIRFAYVSRRSEETSRLVEPHRLVAVDARWYLLAWDRRRDDWRTFRLDRISDARLAGVRFETRPIPGGDPAAFVADNLGAAARSCEVSVEVAASIDEIRAVAPWLADRASPGRANWTRLELRGAELDHVAVQVARLAGAFEVRVPGRSATADALRTSLHEIGTRLLAGS